MQPTNNFTKYLFTCLLAFSCLVGTADISSSEENYKFERMWPTLQQPWYYFPVALATSSTGTIYVSDMSHSRVVELTSDGILIRTFSILGDESHFYTSMAIDSNDDLYVTDSLNHMIYKCTSDGQFITKWGGRGNGNGQFYLPMGIAVDSNDNIYIADKNQYIQKYSKDGQFITQWGSPGSGNGEFAFWDDVLHIGMAIDSRDNIYIADHSNDRIQKFASNGSFIAKWGSQGTGDGEFETPAGIIIDTNGNIIVADLENNRVQSFTPDGQFLTKWNLKVNASELGGPTGIVIDKTHNIYITANYSRNIQKYTFDGRFLTQWSSSGSTDGQFNIPSAIAADSFDNIYVIDHRNHRIQKFASNGSFITQWGSQGTGDGELNFPMGIAIDSNNNVYVSDTPTNSPDRIQVFSMNGQFIHSWSDDDFYWYDDLERTGIAIDSNNNVYVASYRNNIQKFTAEGEFVTMWGDGGTGNGQFSYPTGIAIDSNNNVYVSERGGNHRIQKFTQDGLFLTKWGSHGTDDGQFNRPTGIAIDYDDNIYVSDTYNNRIQKFSSDGLFIGKFGELGDHPGQYNWPMGIVVGKNGNIYIADRGNHRIQIIKHVPIADNNKAIIVSGGGPFPGNNLWDATQVSANFAYRALTYQGFTKESIYYLTSDTGLDLDGNGVSDDVDDDTTNANLQQAITNWAADAENLVIYIVDHGGSGILRMSGTETLSAADLDAWLDQLQQTIPGKVTVIYDACESGSFVPALTPPAGKERIVITSTSPGEQAYFVTQGSVSFSNYFWTHIFNGVNVKDAFDLSRSALSTSTAYQHPLLDANGNGTGNETEDYTLTQSFYIGNGTVIHGDSPLIGSVSDPQTINDQNSAPLFASEVVDNDGIARVWAVIRPPDYNQGLSSNPVNDLPSIDLMPVGGNRFEVSYDGFNIEGTYQLAIYARDRIGNTSIPVLTTVSVNNPLRRKAIIAIGGSQSDPIWPALENLGTQAYESLTFQGYADNDIYFMSPVTFSAGVDGLTTSSNLNYAINTWALINTRDVVIYLIGEGGSGTFELNATETLTASTLDTWIDFLQDNISGKVAVIYDAPQSGSFLPLLTPPADKTRILISSTANDGPAHFLSEGDISFSKFFWRRILDGMNIRDAFINAKNAIYYCQGQTPQLDDNSNGIANEKSDGNVARYYNLGVGIMLAGDDPLIGSVSPEQTLSGDTSAAIWAQDVTTTGSIDKVWAVITPPQSNLRPPDEQVTDLPTVDLTFNAGNNRYEGTYTNFVPYGNYNIAVYAKDTAGNISMPSATVVIQTIGPDVYEGDDTIDSARVITINSENAQTHNFHDAGDQDWVRFYGLAGETYEIKTENLGQNCDTTIDLYNAGGTKVTTTQDDYWYGDGELLSWQCTADGVYYILVKQYNQNDYGQNTGYDLRIYHPTASGVGKLIGRVSDLSGTGIRGAVVRSDIVNATAITLPNGYYIVFLPSGTYNITATAEGYSEKGQSGMVITDHNAASLNFSMLPLVAMDKGDINGDGEIDLSDAILAVKVAGGVNISGAGVAAGADVDEDGKIGLEEVIYILQKSAELRN